MQISRPALVSFRRSAWSLQPGTVVPLIAEELSNDDAEMAGIVRSSSQAPQKHWFWSRPPIKEKRDDTPVSASTVENRKPVHRSILRRLIHRTPLNKTQSLVVTPTTMTAGDQVMVSGWRPQVLAQPVMITDQSHVAVPVVNTAQYIMKRRHCRRHSEQPRSWRKPSADLWTLKEE